MRYTEDLPDGNPDEIGIETIQMMLMTKFIVVDHVAETMTAIVLEEDSDEGRRRAQHETEELTSGRDIFSSACFPRDGQSRPGRRDLHCTRN